MYLLFKSGKYGIEINNEIQNEIDEYIKFGGYPRVVLSDSVKEKKIVLRNIYNTYLLREIREIIDLSDSVNLLFSETSGMTLLFTRFIC